MKNYFSLWFAAILAFVANPVSASDTISLQGVESFDSASISNLVVAVEYEARAIMRADTCLLVEARVRKFYDATLKSQFSASSKKEIGEALVRFDKAMSAVEHKYSEYIADKMIDRSNLSIVDTRPTGCLDLNYMRHVKVIELDKNIASMNGNLSRIRKFEEELQKKSEEFK